MIWLFFIIKHFVCDFPLQKPKHFMNKGIYGHWGGIEHALIHGIGTLWVVCWFANPLQLLIAFTIDFVTHYHIDWLKMWWTAKKKYTPNDSMFWIWLGIDQMLHYLTYWIIIKAVV